MFAEMVQHFRAHWHPGMSFEALISLRDDLDTMLERIRFEGHISPPVFRCRQCGHVGPGATPHVSVRATILALTRFGIAPAGRVRDLEKRWPAYRKRNDLDLRGKPTAPQPGGTPCLHPF